MSYVLVSRAGRDAPLSAVSDMKGALGFVGVFLSFLLGELCGPPALPPALAAAAVPHMLEETREPPHSLSGCFCESVRVRACVLR